MILLLYEVARTLGGQAEVRAPLIVLPENLEEYYHNPKRVVLGVPVLRRGCAAQTFGEGEVPASTSPAQNVYQVVAEATT